MISAAGICFPSGELTGTHTLSSIKGATRARRSKANGSLRESLRAIGHLSVITTPRLRKRTPFAGEDVHRRSQLLALRRPRSTPYAPPCGLESRSGTRVHCVDGPLVVTRAHTSASNATGRKLFGEPITTDAFGVLAAVVFAMTSRAQGIPYPNRAQRPRVPAAEGHPAQLKTSPGVPPPFDSSAQAGIAMPHCVSQRTLWPRREDLLLRPPGVP